MRYRDPKPLLARAIEDLRERTLASFDCEMAKLIYLSSTRDYNTGRYCHHGLESQYSPEVAETALKSSHIEIFRRFVAAPLQFLVDDIGAYFRMAGTDENVVLKSWKQLQPYKVVVPQECGPLMREVFFFNVKAALIVVENRQRLRLRAG